MRQLAEESTPLAARPDEQESLAAGRTAAEPGAGARRDAGPVPRIPRRAERHKLHCRIYFAAGQMEGEGMVYDLSKAGCGVRCETMVEPGMELQLSFFIPDYDWPLRVDRAIVRWTRGQDFGVEFLEMQPSQRERLRLFLATLKRS